MLVPFLIYWLYNMLQVRQRHFFLASILATAKKAMLHI
jgi:hypothetical protein